MVSDVCVLIRFIAAWKGSHTKTAMICFNQLFVPACRLLGAHSLRGPDGPSCWGWMGWHSVTGKGCSPLEHMHTQIWNVSISEVLISAWCFDGILKEIEEMISGWAQSIMWMTHPCGTLRKSWLCHIFKIHSTENEIQRIKWIFRCIMSFKMLKEILPPVLVLYALGALGFWVSDWAFSLISRAQLKQHSTLTDPTLWNMILLYWLPGSRAC